MSANNKQSLSSDNIESYFDRLWPLNRSLMGHDYRASLDILEELVPFKRLIFPTNKKVLDWSIPKEWEVNAAYIIGPDNKKICDFHVNNLHLIGYSSSFKGTLSLDKLKENLHTLKDQPDAIPYITSYYQKRWGFCLTQNQLNNLPNGEYQVLIDTELYDGELHVAEAILKGQSEKEILFTSYLCHPSLANNELSGPLALCFLYNQIKNMPHRYYTYRFVINPETIGSISYLSIRGDHLKANMVAGYVLTCIGDAGNFSYKLTRNGNSFPDRMALNVLNKFKPNIYPFNPADGSDERQYSSPGFNLPMASIMRTKYGEYHEYHSSLDNKNLISFDAMKESVEILFDIIKKIEETRLYNNTEPYGEPQLGNRGLYRTLSTKDYNTDHIEAMFWILNLADGHHELEEISKISSIELDAIKAVALKLKNKGLLK